MVWYGPAEQVATNGSVLAPNGSALPGGDPSSGGGYIVWGDRWCGACDKRVPVKPVLAFGAGLLFSNDTMCDQPKWLCNASAGGANQLDPKFDPPGDPHETGDTWGRFSPGR